MGIIIIIIIIDSSSLSADSSIGDQLQAYVETDNSVYCDVSQLARIVDCAGHRFITPAHSTTMFTLLFYVVIK